MLPLPLASTAAADPAAATPADQGWLYDLLRWMGVNDATALHVSQVLVKPVAVVVILIVAVLAAKLGTRIIRRWIVPVATKAALRSDGRRAAGRVETVAAMTANLWRIVVAIIAVLTILGTVGLNLTPLLAGATVVGATIGFGAQSVVKDLLSGFLLTLEDQYGIGDTITVGTYSGVVEDLSLRVTRIRDADGTVSFIANGEIRSVTNASREKVIAIVDIVVPLATNIERLLQSIAVSAEAFGQDERYHSACLDPPDAVGVVSGAVDSITARVLVHTTLSERLRVERGLRYEIMHRLQTAGIIASSASGAPIGDQSPERT